MDDSIYGRNCIAPDHVLQEFKVVVRSMASVHPDTLKNLIQGKYEVVECAETDIKIVYRK